MAGTIEGGKKAAVATKEKHGADFYARIGSVGGKNGRTGGFAHTKTVECICEEYPHLHYKVQCAGKKGGRKSRRNNVAITAGEA